MYARVVRFESVTDEALDNVKQRVDESDGPPPGVNSSGIRIIHDRDRGTALVVLFFDSAEDMKAADEIMGAMDTGDTPGTRVSVDMGEIVVDRTT